MVSGRFKSRTFRRKSVRVVSGTKRIFELRKPAPAKCRSCSAKLAGVVRGRPTQVSKVPKSQRRPERAYGGVLCPGCTKGIFRQKARSI